MRLFCLLVALLLAGPAWADEPYEGRDVFLSRKCDTCHGVSTAGVPLRHSEEQEEESEDDGALSVPDLAAVPHRDPAVLERYLRRKQAIRGRIHRVTFRGSDAELRALTAWLAEVMGTKGKPPPK